MGEEEKVTRVNIAYPQYGTQQKIEVDDDKKLRIFFEKRMGEEVPADALGEQFKGYVFKITGGMDKEGFAMKQGILKQGRVRILLDGPGPFFHRPKRVGSRKKKSVRGCIVGADMSTINVVITKKGDNPIEGLTDPKSNRPSRLGPKRANNIRKAFRLKDTDDVREFVVRRPLPKKEGKPQHFKAPRIQRLITPITVQRKKRRIILRRRRIEKSKTQAAEYAKLMASIRQQKKQAALSSKRRLSQKRSQTERKPETKEQ